jgi:guanine nucleotide-binding protein alpha-1 subunit
VIQLNMIHSINTILEALQAEINSDPSSSVDLDNIDNDGDISPSTSAPSTTTPPPKITEKHRLLKLRLAPLRRVEIDLRRRLGASTSDDIDNVNGSSQPTYATPFDASTTSYPPSSTHDSSSSRQRRIGAGGGEVVVRSWKYLLQAEERVSPTPSSSRGQREDRESEQGRSLPDPDAASEFIANSKADIKALWEDPVVQAVLTRRKVKLADSAGL